jgi:hypothetical protein
LLIYKEIQKRFIKPIVQHTRHGRPRQPLQDAAHPLTRRVRHLIDTAHRGNVAAASRLTGVSYPTLSDLYVGSSVRPTLRTLEAIAAPYGLEVGWLVAEREPGNIPRLGKMGLVPPNAAKKDAERSLREILIPYAAWPMYEVYSDLEQRLSRMAPGAERPIVGEAQEARFTFRLTTFLLQPLLSAEKLGAGELVAVGTETAGAEPREPLDDTWTTKLRRLGEMWLTVLPGLFGQGAPAAAARPPHQRR